MTQIDNPEIVLHNIVDGETVHQRAVVISGTCRISDNSIEDYLIVKSADYVGKESFPVQNWPVFEGHFKVLIILSPGANFISIEHHHSISEYRSIQVELNYIPLLQTPPLHLAIMIAKDSPLLIDCPPGRRGAISSAHSDLDAAVKKFRMTAYMWQALTAEDLRSKHLGRRSFRLEEEWAEETLSREFLKSFTKSQMSSTAKIHLVRSEKTVAEIRDAQVAQQNERSHRREDLHKYFEEALKKHGGPFVASSHPIVAGLILDSSFSAEQNLILGHAALGCSNTRGLSLGIFGSHLTYSWPRFLEEVASSLLDYKIPGDTVGNDNNECGTMWEACSIGQGAFLHEVGHAFGAPHTSGIMERGYAQDWPKSFLGGTSYCSAKKTQGVTVVDGETPNNSTWDLSDALSFSVQPHFWHPMDPVPNVEHLKIEPSALVIVEDGQEDVLKLVISSPAQICQVKFNGKTEPGLSTTNTVQELQFTMNELEARFDRTDALTLDILGRNGKSRKIGNVWRLFSNVSFIRIPGSSVVLQKKSVISPKQESKDDDDNGKWDWAVLLNEKGKDGKLARAVEIDSRVGCLLDGAVIYFEDGHGTHCGPRWDNGGRDHHFGGHASEKFVLPEGVEVTKVEVGLNHELNGLRFHLSNGFKGGYLYDDSSVQTLEPAATDKIIGFYGQSEWGQCFDGIEEFGIITAPRDVDLPMIIYDLPELQNTDGGTGPRPERNDDSEDE
ncbi:hypothetical protein V496_10441 [Pseudogymnoascus sp. VKM F-4515 (FW-2607)]|nr:hypothetical protein V496_10441 [Pseudogymnoascus sp. VKM F-4515 (FW-2607)]KFY95093.1 hypothetical protein V498_03521 [Pseudogymnoascus sp. VKM F-4517 (FW-2822)]